MVMYYKKWCFFEIINYGHWTLIVIGCDWLSMDNGDLSCAHPLTP